MTGEFAVELEPVRGEPAEPEVHAWAEGVPATGMWLKALLLLIVAVQAAWAGALALAIVTLVR